MRANLNAVGRTTLRPRVVGTGVGTWMPSRKINGMNARPFYAVHRGEWQHVASMVTMPKAHREANPNHAVVVVDNRPDGDAKPIFFASPAEARRYAETLVRL